MCGMVSLSATRWIDRSISLHFSYIYAWILGPSSLFGGVSSSKQTPSGKSIYTLYSIGPWWWSRESPTVYAGSKCRPGSRLLQIPRTRTRDKDISLARALNCLKCYYTKTFFLSFSCFFSVCLSSPLVFLLWYSISYRSIASVFFFSIYRIYVWGVYILSIPMSL
jgi:hypothetical protein